MRIVNLKQFLAMPDGTVFAKYAPCYFEALCIKTATVGERDFCYQELSPGAFDNAGSYEWSDKLDDAERLGIDLPLTFDQSGRDGAFVDEQLFAVLSVADVGALIAQLAECKSQMLAAQEKQ